MISGGGELVTQQTAVRHLKNKLGAAMWIVYALVVHVLLLGSIFVIYFRSPVITGLKPQKELLSYGLEAPANRLVLIVTDGFRADSFFEGNCATVPHLREIFVREGLVGVSRTHVPTESRPGHIALLAGLYEDPSAVLRGWKKNPVDFDTIFHRVKYAYSWGAEDIIEVFEHLSNSKNKHFRYYTQHLDFSPGYETYQLDDWVLKKVKLLLERKAETLRRAKPVIFFLHLLGLDTAGHVHKPGTPKFLVNVEKTERGIYDIYKEFEKVFPDKRTTYLLTSDHGMTDSGMAWSTYLGELLISTILNFRLPWRWHAPRNRHSLYAVGRGGVACSAPSWSQLQVQRRR